MSLLEDTITLLDRQVAFVQELSTDRFLARLPAFVVALGSDHRLAAIMSEMLHEAEELLADQNRARLALRNAVLALHARVVAMHLALSADENVSTGFRPEALTQDKALRWPDLNRMTSVLLDTALELAQDHGPAALAPLATGALAVKKTFDALRTAVANLDTPDKRLEMALAQEAVEAATGRQAEILERVRRIEEAGKRVSEADFARRTRRFARAYAAASDPKKRKLLVDALLGSFDVEMYDDSDLDHLWDLIDQVTYADLRLLKELVEAKPGPNGDQSPELGEVRAKFRVQKGGSAGHMSARRLIDLGLGWSAQRSHSSPENWVDASDLGRKLYGLALQLRDDGEKSE